MGIKKYYTTKNGKKVHSGWKAELIVDRKTVEYKLFHSKLEKSKAQYWLEQRQKAINAGTYDEPKDYSLKEVIEHYRSSKRWTEITTSSRCYYNTCHKNFMRLDSRWLDTKIKDLNVYRVTQLLEALKESIQRKRKHYSREIDYLSTCFGYYHDSLDFNFQSPITKIHKYEFGKMARRSGKKRSNTVKISFDKNQVINLFEKLRLDGSHLPHQFEIIYYYIVAVQFTFGLRLGEACGLEWKDVDFERNVLRLTGTMQWYGEDGKITRNQKVNRLKEEGDLEDDEALEYPMPDEMASIFKTIKALNRSDRWVMANRSGDVPQYSKIYARLMRTGFFDEVGQCSHKLRKTAKTLGQILAGEKMSIDLMRHSSSAVSDRYLDDSVLAKHNPIPGLLSKMIGN